MAMQVFAAVAERGGFSAAADHLHLSRAAVSRHVMQLENHLGARLLNRTTRRVSLTETGRIYYERCQSILADLEEAEACAGQASSTPSGRLLVNAPMSFGTRHLGPAIARYCETYPDVQLALDLNDRFVDVVAEGYDCVVRIARLVDSDLIARRLAPCRMVLCAAPAYLEKFATPRVPQDLALHRCLVYATTGDSWTFHGPDGEESVRVSGPVCANNGEILLAAAKQGLGVALQPTFIAAPDIHAGRLRVILEDYRAPEVSIFTVYPSRRHLSAKVRTFVDFLAEHFGEDPPWDRLMAGARPN